MCELGPHGLHKFFDNLKKTGQENKLVNLYLDHCKLDDSAFADLATDLKV
jgi:hypothetical protein